MIVTQRKISDVFRSFADALDERAALAQSSTQEQNQDIAECMKLMRRVAWQLLGVHLASYKTENDASRPIEEMLAGAECAVKEI